MCNRVYSLMDIDNMRERFEALDSDGDGYVTVSELKGAMKEVCMWLSWLQIFDLQIYFALVIQLGNIRF